MNKYTLSTYLKPALDIISLDETASTNIHAAELIRSRALERDTLVTAVRQTAGKGRIGRSFFSPDGGIYMSLALKTAVTPETAQLLTPAAAVAVCRAIKKICRVDCGIKWVNDIELNGKKLCGILCESLADAVIVGVGLNFQQTAPFPPELSEIAATLYNSTPEIPPEALAGEIINQFREIFSALPATAFIDEYRARSTLLGHKIFVHTPLETYPATAKDIDEQCRLIIETPSGEKISLSTGEVSVRKA